jgi:hypothetical protein
MSTPEHSPLPWRVSQPTPTFVTDADGRDVVVANNGNSANARLIVRAVNAHDALIAAAKAFLAKGDRFRRTELQAAIDAAKELAQ